MNYDTATNYQLNKKLAELIGMRVATVDDAPFNYHANDATPEERFSAYRERYPNTVWCLKDNEPWEQYVFTSDWNATMPLAVEHGVYYYPSKNGYDGRRLIDADHHGHRYQQKSTDKKPLRAIVICLIKVLENKNAN